MKKIVSVFFLVLSINAQSNSILEFRDEGFNEDLNNPSIFRQNTNLDEIDKYDYKSKLSNKSNLAQDPIVAGFIDFSVIGNADGSCTESSPCQGSQDWGGFPTSYTGRVNQSDGSGWFFHGGGASGNNYQAMLSRIIRDSGWDYLQYDTFQYRWTYEDDNYAYSAYTDGSLIQVGFEIWNITKGYRLIPWLYDYDTNQAFGLHATDHPGSGGSNDPHTDWIYPRLPLDASSGEAGYQAWLQKSLSAGIANGGSSTPNANGSYTNADFFSEVGEEVMGRNIFYVWNLDDVLDGTIDAYSGNDADGDGIGDNKGMEKGTILQIKLGPATSTAPFFVDSDTTINIGQANLSDTLFVSWEGATTNSKGYHAHKVYLDDSLISTFPSDSAQAWGNSFYSFFTYKYFIDKWPSEFESLPRKIFKLYVWAYANGDSVKSDIFPIFVNRYEYLTVENKSVPTSFALHENYPNPFNPSTTLRFDLPEVSNLKLTIFNTLGQKIRSYDMQSTPAGHHALEWNATNDYGDPVGAGVYLYQLQTKDFVETRKMVLLK